MIEHILNKVGDKLTPQERGELVAWANKVQSLLDGIFRNGLSQVTSLAQISPNAGRLYSGGFIAPAAGLNPEDADFTGSFVLAEGVTFSGTTYHVGAVAAGVLGVGFNTSGQLVAGAGVVSVDSTGVTLTMTDTGGTTHPATNYLVDWYSDTYGQSFIVGWVADYGAVATTYLKVATDGTGLASEVGALFSSTDSAANTGAISFYIGSLAIFDASKSLINFNDGGEDIDTVIEGNTDTLLFNLDAGLDMIGIGKVPAYKHDVNGDQNATAYRINGNLAKLPQYIVKTSNETVNNSATLQNDNDFSFAIAANEKWLVELFLAVTSASANADFKFAFTSPSGCADHYAPISNVGTGATGFLEGTGGGAVSLGTRAGTTMHTITNIVSNGATAGTVQFQWAQDTATAEDTTVLANSIMRYTRLA